MASVNGKIMVSLPIYYNDYYIDILEIIYFYTKENDNIFIYTKGRKG